jgi:hypothetical protein
VDAGHGFLTDVAALREADRLLHAPHFLRQVGGVHVHRVKRHAGLDAEHVEGFHVGRRGAARREDLAKQACLLAQAQQVITRQPQQVTPPDLCGNRWADRACNVFELPEGGGLCAHNAAKDLRGLRTGEMKLDPLRSPVDQLELLRDVKMIEVLDNGHAHAGSHIEPKIALLHVIDEGVADDLGLPGREIGFTAGAGGEVDHIVRAHVVQETSGIGSGDFDFAPVGNIEHNGPLVSDGVLLGKWLRHWKIPLVLFP